MTSRPATALRSGASSSSFRAVGQGGGGRGSSAAAVGRGICGSVNGGSAYKGDRRREAGMDQFGISYVTRTPSNSPARA
jgi:hypothetical protein